MKDRVAEIVVVSGDEDGERDEEEGEEGLDRVALLVREGCETHEAGCVDHGELVYELHWVCLRVSVILSIWIPQRIHLSVEWNMKLPVPTMRYPIKVTMKI